MLPENRGAVDVNYDQLSSKIINEAISYKERAKNPREALGVDYCRKFNRIVVDIFELECIICNCAVCESDVYQAQYLVDGIVYWLEEYVGKGKMVGKFYVTEFAEVIQERIYELSYMRDLSLTIIKQLARSIDHLAFRVCTYFGYLFETIKLDLGSEADNALHELQYGNTEIDYYEFDDEYDGVISLGND